MNRPGPHPTSPLSAGSSDSFPSRYGSMGTPLGGDNGYGAGPYGAARPPQMSPPVSQHPSSSTDVSRPSLGSSVGRPPSSASSIARSSDGRMFGGPGQRDSAKSAMNPHNEDALQRHYITLKSYLSAILHDDKGNVKPNRARDKLLRLSVTQFMELSTDVFDELIRREDERLQRVANVPRALPPKQNFHPKRNQARQKLSTLPLDRFRQLATDVYYELERRIPRFAGGDIDRPISAASSRAPSRGGMRPPPPGFRPPPPGAGGRPPMSPGPNGMLPPRPLPKQFQSNTMVPNKSTMVEDDDDDEPEDTFALNRVVTGFSEHPGTPGKGSAEDKEKIQAQEVKITELEARLDDLEGSIKDKDSALNSLRQELEQKHLGAQKLNEDLRHELDHLHREKSQDERDIRAQHDRTVDDLRAQLEHAHSQTDDLHDQLRTYQTENGELRHQLQGQQTTTSDSEYERRIELLQEELSNQEKITNEVRDEATMYLREMRDLSRENDKAIEQEEQLAAQVAKLENQIDTWRQRYAKVKSQNKSLRASALGLGLQNAFDAGSLFRKEALVSEGGLVKDVDVSRFQMSIDELLKVARQSSTDAMLDSVKNVVVCVQSISSAVGMDGYPTPSPSPDSNAQPPMSVGKLKARVTGTANSLITATKQHASASGLSPVALLDAAASNLTSSVIELIKAVGIRPSPKSELEDAEVEPSPRESMGSFYDDRLSQNGDEPYSPPADASAPSVQIDAPDSKPVALGLGRSNTLKKVNGWFGWGSKAADDVPPTPTMNGHPATRQSDEYDPYRQ
ncbi:component of the polarisome [Vermiconidia calcicola]|uniref:Component of the polarisome n=1 Tax=Vermiconidia calcicola TaxID=1690605 RepID=A0ACC3NZN9_9PEZI|nr:component of the polarisome [Vermiconidia calcicola]